MPKKTLLLVLIFTLLISNLASEEISYYDEAKNLYAKGPKYAKEIILLLNKAINQNPNHGNSHSLLGMTYFGIGEFDKAISAFDWIIERAQANKEDDTLAVPGKILILRIVCLVYTHKFAQARESIRKYGAYIIGKKHEKDYQKLIDELNYREKLYLAVYSRKLIEARKKLILKDHLFIPVRHKEKRLIVKDKDLKHFNLDSDLKSTLNFVVGISESGNEKYGYCVYLKEFRPFKLARFLMTDFDNGKIDKEALLKNLEDASGLTLEISSAEFAGMQIMEFPTDSGKKLMGFKKSGVK